MDNKKVLRKTIFWLSLLTVLLLATGMYLISNAKNDTYAEKELFLQEISSKNALLIKTKVDALLDKMKSLSVLLGKNAERGMESILEVLREESSNNEFKRMGIITPGGKAITTDGHIIDFSDREYYKLALEGKSNVSSRLIDRTDGQSINVFATPFYTDDKIVGVLFGTKNTGAMAELLTFDSFLGQGFSYIINKDGTPIVFTNNENSHGEFDNLFDEIATNPQNLDKLDKFKTALEAGKNGTIVLARGEEARQMSYNKIGINDWYIVTSVSAGAISQNSDMLVVRVIWFVVIIVLTFLGVSIMTVSHFRKNNKMLELIAFVDDVTGAENWNKFKLDGNRTLSKDGAKKHAIMALDIDKFKVINDLYGHGEGNSLLKHLAWLIDLSIGSSESFARVSGDNFVVLLEHTDNERLQELTRYISEQMRDFIPGYIIQMSFGIYVIDDMSLDISAMYDRASMAKKMTKESTHANLGIYNESVRETILREKDIENEMRAALDAGQFQIYLHPKYLFSNSGACGAEALVRWIHPVKGIIPPNEFIPLFEKNGFIQQVDTYVFEEVCITLARWRRENNPLAELCISVNLSRACLGAEHLVSKLQNIAKKHGVNPASIEIELTESAVFNDVEQLILIMKDFKSAGFMLSIDDFGSGYSSLNTLKDLPVDAIKFDRKFLQEASDNVRGKVIIASLVDMAKVLLLQTVAEGVETSEQVAFLKKAGCDVAQGFFFAKPMPIKDFEDLLDATNKA